MPPFWSGVVAGGLTMALLCLGLVTTLISLWALSLPMLP